MSSQDGANAEELKVYRKLITPLFVGTLLSSILFGAVIVLAIRYYAVWKRDRWFLKVLVGACLVIGCVDEVAWALWCRRWITAVSVEQLLDVLPGGMKIYIATIGMSACLVQLWYSFALYKCCTSTRLNRIVVAILVAIPPVAMFILGWILFARMYHTKSFIDLPSQRTISLACIAANLSVDFYLTASLVFFLMIKPSRESGGIFRSSSQIKNLVVAVLRTNFLATSAQATALALVVARPHGTEFCVVSGMIPKIYLASLIGTLLSRTPPPSSSHLVLPTASTILPCQRCRSVYDSRTSGPMHEVEVGLEVGAAVDEEKGEVGGEGRTRSRTTTSGDWEDGAVRQGEDAGQEAQDVSERERCC